MSDEINDQDESGESWRGTAIAGAVVLVGATACFLVACLLATLLIFGG